MADRDIAVAWGATPSPKLWSRVTAQYVTFTAAPTLVAGGSPATITGVQVALLPYRSRGPGGLTVWTNVSWTPGVGAAPGTVSMVVQGPDLQTATAVPLLTIPGPSGVDLWARVVDTPEVAPQFICRIDMPLDPTIVPGSSGSVIATTGVVNNGDGTAVVG